MGSGQRMTEMTPERRTRGARPRPQGALGLLSRSLGMASGGEAPLIWGGGLPISPPRLCLPWMGPAGGVRPDQRRPMPLSAWWCSEGTWQGHAGGSRGKALSAACGPSIPMQAADAMIYGMRMKFESFSQCRDPDFHKKLLNFVALCTSLGAGEGGLNALLDPSRRGCLPMGNLCDQIPGKRPRGITGSGGTNNSDRKGTQYPFEQLNIDPAGLRRTPSHERKHLGELVW